LVDVFTKAQRSDVMRCVRGRGNKSTEVAFAKALHAARITGWRRHQQIRVTTIRNHPAPKTRRSFRSQPDFVFRRLRVAVFLDGCFWHCCPWHGAIPEHNAAFWRKKLRSNAERDRNVTSCLRQQGWRVIRIWEHRLQRDLAGCVALVQAALCRS
jgi:DNA mismatch endonuclease (patch repair protein)